MKTIDLSKIKKGDKIRITVKDEENKEIDIKEGEFNKIDQQFGQDTPYIIIDISKKRTYGAPLAWVVKIEKLDN